MIDIGKCDKINISDYSPILTFNPNGIKLIPDNLVIINETDWYIANKISLTSSHCKWLIGVLKRYFLSLQP